MVEDVKTREKTKEEQRQELFDGVITALELAIKEVDHPDLYEADKYRDAAWIRTISWGLAISVGEEGADYTMRVYLPEMSMGPGETVGLEVPRNYRNRRQELVDLTHYFRNALQETTGHEVVIRENDHLY